MKRLLKYPAVNAICIGMCSGFYALVFFAGCYGAKIEGMLYYQCAAGVLLALTALVVILLLRRRPYDEYYTSILAQCLMLAIVLTMMAIAIFYAAILHDPVDIIEKFTLFIMIHWSTVVFANLAFVLLCRRA